MRTERSAIRCHDHGRDEEDNSEGDFMIVLYMYVCES